MAKLILGNFRTETETQNLAKNGFQKRAPPGARGRIGYSQSQSQTDMQTPLPNVNPGFVASSPAEGPNVSPRPVASSPADAKFRKFLGRDAVMQKPQIASRRPLTLVERPLALPRRYSTYGPVGVKKVETEISPSRFFFKRNFTT